MDIATQDYSKLSEEVKKYVRSFFNDITSSRYKYHNLAHTESVVAAANQIADHYKLNEHDLFIVNAGAWFHDVGYFTVLENHEEKGVAIAENFFKDKGLDADTIAGVKNCILATRIPQKPTNLLEQIICDADLFHLGTDKFMERNKEVRNEIEELTGNKIKKKVWREQSIELLEGHHYFTDYCNQLLEAKKKENLKALQTMKENAPEKKHAHQDEEKKHGHHHSDKKKHSHPESEIVIDQKKSKSEIKEDEKIESLRAKDAPADKGVQTMFRITSGNNQKLSDMADNKAHIMITVNSIILSVVIGVLFRKLDPDNSIVYPTMLFIAISLATIIFAILATRPSIPNGIFTKEDITNKKVNLLFFGNFYKMSLEDYTEGMFHVMEDRSFLYSSLIKDVYAQAVVLGRKYRQLRISYNIFMFGLIASVLGYVIALMFFTPEPLQTVLQTNLYKNPTGYDLSQPEKISLPSALNEVSGIAFNKGNSDTIYAQQDENSLLFHFQLGDKNEFTTKFGKKGDYEDLTICKRNVTLLRSDGVLFTFPLGEANQSELTDAKEWDNLLPGAEYESMASIESTGEIFVLCKHDKGSKDEKSKGYIFKQASDGSIISSGKFNIDWDEIAAKTGDKKTDFRPSGMALNPCTNEWYIISSVNKLLVVTDPNFKVKEVYSLKPTTFRQPEGIAFDDDCNLYISNEKTANTKPSILKFTYQ